MAKLIILMGILFLMALITFCVIGVIRSLRTYQGNRTVKEGWKVVQKESESHPITSVYLVYPGKREFFKSVDRLGDDYEQEIWDICAAAQDECDDRNSFERSLRESHG